MCSPTESGVKTRMKNKSLKKMILSILLVLTTVGILFIYLFRTTITAEIEYYTHTEKYDAAVTYYAEKYKTGDTEDTREYHDGLWTCVYYDECGRMRLHIRISETDLHNEQGDYRVLSL